MQRLSRAAAQRLQKPHTGYEAFVEPLAKLVESFSGRLVTDGIDVGAHAHVAGERAAARAERATLAEELALVDDTQLADGSTCWQQMMIIYAAARAAARVNPQIEAAIDPFVQFMKTGPHKAKKTAPTTP